MAFLIGVLDIHCLSSALKVILGHSTVGCCRTVVEHNLSVQRLLIYISPVSFLQYMSSISMDSSF